MADAKGRIRETVVGQLPQSVVNQRWIREGILKQRVRHGGGCVDLVINTYTVNVHSQVPVACNAPRRGTRTSRGQQRAEIYPGQPPETSGLTFQRDLSESYV